MRIERLVLFGATGDLSGRYLPTVLPSARYGGPTRRQGFLA